jgi:hypothetical protein
MTRRHSGRCSERVGFTQVERKAVGESEHEALREIERHAEAAGDDTMNRFETLVVETTKAA